mmetsp:Transcript_96748/g.311817  ORF Transcript_96748/g.311817 Transcript_96748/m.311817 type:complete len:624 (+) Transcript_96748:1018-2889(+)
MDDQALQEGVHAILSFQNGCRIARDADSGHGVLFVLLVDGDLDVRARIGLELLDDVSVGALQRPGLVLVDAHQRHLLAPGCRGPLGAACRGGAVASGTVLGAHGRDHVLVAGLDLLRRAIDRDLVALAVDEHPLILALDFPRVALLGAHDHRGLLRADGHHLLARQVQSSQLPDAFLSLLGHSVHDQALRRGRPLGEALSAVRAVDDDTMILLQLGLVQKAEDDDLGRELDVRRCHRCLLNLLRLQALGRRHAGGDALLVAACAHLLRGDVVSGHALGALLTQGVELVLELGEDLPPVRLRELLPLVLQHLQLHLLGERGIGRALPQLLVLIQNFLRINHLRSWALRLLKHVLDPLHDALQDRALLRDLTQHLLRADCGTQLRNGVHFLEDGAGQLLVVLLVLVVQITAHPHLLCRRSSTDPADRGITVVNRLGLLRRHLLGLLTAALLLHSLHAVLVGLGGCLRDGRRSGHRSRSRLRLALARRCHRLPGLRRRCAALGLRRRRRRRGGEAAPSGRGRRWMARQRTYGSSCSVLSSCSRGSPAYHRVSSSHSSLRARRCTSASWSCRRNRRRRARLRWRPGSSSACCPFATTWRPLSSVSKRGSAHSLKVVSLNAAAGVWVL